MDNNCRLRHTCNKVERDGRLCWDRQHKAMEHQELGWELVEPASEMKFVNCIMVLVGQDCGM